MVKQELSQTIRDLSLVDSVTVLMTLSEVTVRRIRRPSASYSSMVLCVGEKHPVSRSIAAMRASNPKIVPHTTAKFTQKFLFILHMICVLSVSLTNEKKPGCLPI